MCDVCDEPALFLCGECRAAVYCSTRCQAADWEQHYHYECVHPSDMHADMVREEMEMHLEHADQHDDQQLIALGTRILERGTHDEHGRAWLEQMIGAELIGLFGRRRRRGEGFFARIKRKRRKRRKRRRRRKRRARRKGRLGAARTVARPPPRIRPPPREEEPEEEEQRE